VGRAPEGCGQSGGGIALRGVDLGLREEETVGQVRTAEVGGAKVGPDEVSASQVHTPEVGSDEIRPAQ
jgi:hypothetical protein